MITNKDLIAIDIGNSRIKIISDGEFYASEYDTNWQSLLTKILDDFPDAILGYSSVNTTIEIQLLKLLDSYKSLTRINTVELLCRQHLLDYSEVSGIGSDRLLGMLGALTDTSPPLVTIDCGTAVTFNVIDSRGKCLGGAIFPGIFTQFQSLASISSVLKPVKVNFKPDKIGNSTETAVNLGVILSVVGGIEQLLKLAINNGIISPDSPIYLTGGYGHHIQPYLEQNYSRVTLKQDLVLRGIIRLMQDFSLD